MRHRWVKCAGLGAALGLALGVGGGAAPARAADKTPIKIGVISEESAIVGKAISQGAQLAADDINAHGGVLGRKLEIITYDDHSSAAEAVRAFQRAVQQDHVNAVVTTFISEVALAVEPWAARLHTVTVTPAAASNLISKQVHDNYNRFKYMFQAWLPAPLLAQSVCDSADDILVKPLHVKTAVIMSEDADWTKPLDDSLKTCLPKVGVKVLDEVRFNPDTTDFTPIYNRIEGQHPDVIITGWAHVGVQPTVQWHAQQVPIPIAGISAQADSSEFAKTTNDAVNGIITETGVVQGVAITPKTIPVVNEFIKKFGVFPEFTGLTAYDSVQMLAQAMDRAHSTNSDKLVTAMEKTNYVGTLGRIAFYGRNDTYTHAMRYGKDYVTSTYLQWQDGKQVCIWPRNICPNKLEFPPFVKLPTVAAK